MKRPLIPVAFLYVAGILLAALPVALVPLFAIAFALIILFAVWPAARNISLAALLVLAGWINFTQCTTILSPHDLRNLILQDDNIASVRGVLRETPSHHIHHSEGRIYETSTSRLDIREISLGESDWQPAVGRILINTSGDLSTNFFAGQIVEISGVIRIPDGAVANGSFDYRAYLANQGIYFELAKNNESQWRVLGGATSPPLADRFRDWAKKTLALGLPYQDQSLSLEWALTLGSKSILTDDVADPFIKAATYHIFAVDGLRVAIVSGILFFLLRALRVPRPICALIIAPCLLFYAAMTGWPASAIRAIVMLLVVFGSWILNRPGDLLNSLFAAALIILVGEPRQLFQAGFQLSFFVVLCIVLIMPFFKQLNQRILKPDPLLPESLQPRWKKILRDPVVWLVDLFLTSLAAWLGSIPLVAWYFHILTPGSGPANVLAVPLCGLVLICNLASLLLGAWFPFAAIIFNHAGWFCMESIRVTSQWSAHWPGAYFYVPVPGLFTIGLYYAALISIFTGWLFKNPRRVWKISSLAALCLIWLGFWLYQRPATELTVLPLGEGFGVYLRSHHSSEDWLIDCGNERAVEMTTAPYLHAHGVNRLSHLVLTHGNINYAGGAKALFESFHPQSVLLNPVLSRSPDYRAFTSFLKTNLAPQPAVKPGAQFPPWTVLHPDPAAPAARADDNAIVLLGNFDGLRVLLLSNLGRLGQLDLLSGTNQLHADILIAAAPPDTESASDPFSETLLEAIQPRVIILHSSSIRTISDRLHQQLNRRHIPILYTAQTQAVTLTTRPGQWCLTPMTGPIISDSEFPRSAP